MSIKEYLPIGSVVLLKNAKKKLVVIGIKQIIREEQVKEYDYIGVLFPEGYLNSEMMVGFNHSDINDVIFSGYHNPEREYYLEKADEYLKTKEEKE